MQNEIVDKLAAIPGVTAVGFASAAADGRDRTGLGSDLHGGRERIGEDDPADAAVQECIARLFSHRWDAG